MKKFKILTVISALLALTLSMAAGGESNPPVTNYDYNDAYHWVEGTSDTEVHNLTKSQGENYYYVEKCSVCDYEQSGLDFERCLSDLMTNRPSYYSVTVTSGSTSVTYDYDGEICFYKNGSTKIYYTNQLVEEGNPTAGYVGYKSTIYNPDYVVQHFNYSADDAKYDNGYATVFGDGGEINGGVFKILNTEDHYELVNLIGYEYTYSLKDDYKSSNRTSMSLSFNNGNLETVSYNTGTRIYNFTLIKPELTLPSV